MVVFIVGVGVLAHWLVPEGLRAAVAAQPIWLQLTEALVIADLGFYITHRTFHTIPWLWKFHAIHHSIEEMDWLAAGRVHPVDQVLTKGMSLLPLFALGFSEAAIGIHALIYHWQAYLIHANVRISFGPLRWLIASPEFHHWHHGNHPEAYNKNYAGQLAFLDKLFGTMHMPEGQMPAKYGVDEPVPQQYFLDLIYPFRRAREPEVSADRNPALDA
jgi:sterol desaturase/sphingolipid hydroxylase (fatty acid hydroxylase superfamily)